MRIQDKDKTMPECRESMDGFNISVELPLGYATYEITRAALLMLCEANNGDIPFTAKAQFGVDEFKALDVESDLTVAEEMLHDAFSIVVNTDDYVIAGIISALAALASEPGDDRATRLGIASTHFIKAFTSEPKIDAKRFYGR